MLPIRRLAIYAARRIAANPQARAKAFGVAQQIAAEGKRIASDPSPARAAGRTTRRLAEELRRRFRSES
jgi:hypothetical protein